MNIVSYDLAKATLLFPLEEISPLRGINNARIVNDIVNKYQFAKYPNIDMPREELGKTGLKFENGIFMEGQINITEFSIFSDGIVVGARTTDEAESFIADMLLWVRQTYGFREFMSTPVSRFISQIVVEFNKRLLKLLRDSNEIVNLVSKRISDIYEEKITLDLARVDLDFDKLGTKSPLIVPRFIIERRPGAVFERERYYCFAPLRTRDHVSILEEIEKSIT